MNPGTSFARLDFDTTERFVALRRDLGVTSFGMNLIVLQPGQRGRIHRHERQEEVYLVLRGVLSLSIEGLERDLGVGELARVAPELRRQLINRGPETLAILALGAAGTHDGRDGVAFPDWDSTTGGPPQEVALPDDLPEHERRAARR